jgi:CRISPR/Cas system-associated exonuclease Cas4 (RecB family)
MPRSGRSAKSKPRSRTQKVKPGLRGFADAKKPSVDLLRDIRAFVVAQEAQHGNDNREKRKIHVSDLTKDDPCPRRLYYRVSGEVDTDVPKTATAQLIAIWSAGTAEHEKWQRWLQQMGDLWGSWTCLVCEHKWQDTSPEECPECYSALLRYDEVELEDTEYPLVGHADGAVPRLNALVEIKSFAVGSVRVEDPRRVAEYTIKHEGKTLIDQEGLWKSLKRPLKSHLAQGTLYLWMCQRVGLPYDRIIFIYENKTNQATKTFEVRLTQRAMAEPLALLAAVKDAVTTGDTPDRPRNFAPDALPCRECPFKTKCWGDNDDDRSASAAVPARRPRTRSEAPGGEAEVRPSATSAGADSGGAGRHHRTRRPVAGGDDDAADSVGRAPRGATGDGGGGRAVGGSGDGEGARPRFARRNR